MFAAVQFCAGAASTQEPDTFTSASSTEASTTMQVGSQLHAPAWQ
jgi:xylose isomerase